MPIRADSLLSTIAEASTVSVKDHYKLVVMGASRVGKSAIIQRFLYNNFPVKYIPTIEEFHSGEFDFNATSMNFTILFERKHILEFDKMRNDRTLLTKTTGNSITLDIIDTSGSYEFPAMRRLSIETGDAFLLACAVDDADSFEQVVQLRDEILSYNNKERRSIIVVANKADLSSDLWRIKRELTETLVSIDWEVAYVECSAKESFNIIEIFRRIMLQCKIPYELNERIVNKQRRRSLPVHNTQPSLKDKALLKRNSCNVS